MNIRGRVEKLEAAIGADGVTLEVLVLYSMYLRDGERDHALEERIARSTLGKLIAAAIEAYQSSLMRRALS